MQFIFKLWVPGNPIKELVIVYDPIITITMYHLRYSLSVNDYGMEGLSLRSRNNIHNSHEQITPGRSFILTLA